MFVTPGGTFISPNLTPDPANHNLPDGGHTFAQFRSMMRTGHDADPPHDILQVMPWPVYGNMSDDHWSRARAGENAEALEYYRERSRAPGVAPSCACTA